MIPLCISLKNFLSYGQELQTINFQPYSFICLSGKNGHGKSALLDAITWALWGQARKTAGASRADESLLRLSQNSMLVIFDFLAHGQHYRIKREFLKMYSKGTVTLDFGFINKDGACVALSTKTIKETQSLIEQTIGIDFETFINSVFLRQGGASEFSKKTPRERKEILGKILSLSHYEEIKRKANEKIKILSTEYEYIARTQEQRDTEKNKYNTVHEQLCAIQKELTETIVAETNNIEQQRILQNMLNQLQADILFLNSEFLQQKQVASEKKSLEVELHLLRTQWTVHLKQKIVLKDLFKIQNRKNELLHIVLQEQDLRDQKIELLNHITTKKNLYSEISLKEERARFKIQEQSTKINESLKTQKEQYVLLLKKNQLLLIKKLDELVDNAKILEDHNEKQKNLIKTEKENNFLLQRFEKRISLYQKLSALHKTNTTYKNDLEKKLSLINKKDSNQACPLCETSLLSHQKDKIDCELREEQNNIEHYLHRIELLLKQLMFFHNTYRDFKKICIKTIDDREKNDVFCKQRFFQNNELKSQIETLNKEIIMCQKQIDLITHQLTQEEIIYHKEIEQITALSNLKNIKNDIILLEHTVQQSLYNEKRHLEAKHELQKLDTTRIDQSENKLNQVLFEIKEQIKTICSALKKIKVSMIGMNTIDAKIITIKRKESELLLLMSKQIKIKDEIIQKKEYLVQEKTKLNIIQNNLETLSELYKADEKKSLIIKESINQYTMITQATGKDGIQALLIESAIPELEYEANAILSRLSNNQMHIFIESLKDLKSGKTKETLDIKISDPEGIRAYELFSGGEAFRIDLALRIAISKLLANRSGTTLQTLIIDEGFGSQDEEGISQIIDSLYKIQDDFQKIIIVSHLTSMKEQIPVHFVVHKTNLGSSIQIIE